MPISVAVIHIGRTVKPEEITEFTIIHHLSTSIFKSKKNKGPTFKIAGVIINIIDAFTFKILGKGQSGQRKK